MKAFVLAAGLGTRLGKLTENKPKCLVEVAGQPIIKHVVSELKIAGVNSIVVNLHYLKDQVIEYFQANNNFDLDVHFSHEEALLDTGGAILKARTYLSGSEPFFVHNADIYSNQNLKDLYLFHRNKNPLATLMTDSKSMSRSLLFGENSQLAGWENSDTGEKNVLKDGKLLRKSFCGVHLVSANIFSLMQDFESEKFSIVEVYLKAIREGLDVLSYDIDNNAYWNDVGTPKDLELVNAFARSEEK